MRGFIAALTLFVAIGGLLVVIAFGASEAYYALRNDEANLYDQLLLGAIGEPTMTSTELTGLNYNEMFVTPCLQTPLLEGVGINGRGAALIGSQSGAAQGAQVLALQTSLANSRAIMSDVGRDTENNCQRGVTVGTVERATVVSDATPGADDAIFVAYDRAISGETRQFVTAIVRDGEYIALLSHEITDGSPIGEADVLELATSVVSRFESPPTAAELAAAGVATEPAPVERVARWANDQSTRLLSASDRFPVEVGLGVFGGVVLVLYIGGARLARTPAPSRVGRQSDTVEPETTPTLDDYGDDAPARRWIKSSAGPKAESEEAPDDLDDGPMENVPEDVPAPVAPSPVLDFPQMPIEEKLKILKEARLKEPRREHRAVRDVTPEVDWTEEISRPDAPRAPEANPVRPEPVSRKALLKQLRSQSPD